jgi:hypothetical protein
VNASNPRFWKRSLTFGRLVRLLGFDLKPIKLQAAPQTGRPKLKSKWYRPQTLAALASGPSTATNLTAIAWERLQEGYVLGVGGPWPSDIAAHYAEV